MIFIKRFLDYLKYIGIFIIIELLITFIVSLFNLIGLNSGITSIIMLISNIILFFILNYYNAKKRVKRGYLEGLLLGIILLFIIFIINLILFDNIFSISTLIYYLILLITSILAGMAGINKK